jgi:hypothetical protein
MKRRRITIGGQSITTIGIRHAEIKEQVKERFKDSEYVDKFLETLLRTGWDSLDIDSAVRQVENYNRPSVQTFLFHNEHVLDQIILNQGTYTHFQDTAEDPNYALRHHGQTELILRRLTPGDLMMLNAAHRTSANLGDDDRPSEELPHYWGRIWQGLLDQMPEGATLYAENNLVISPMAAASAALDFVMTTLELDSLEELTPQDISHAFMNPRLPFYCGVSAEYSRDRSREGAGYINKSVWTFTHVESDESLWMLACVVLCYGVDNVARVIMAGDRTNKRGHKFYAGFLRILSNRERLSKYERANHVHQETNQHTTAVSTNRLLP